MIRGTHRLSLALLLGSFAAVGMAQPPTAPPPRPVPTQAELIVGVWVLAKMDGRPALKEIDVIRSFSHDGKAKSYLRLRNGQLDNVSAGVYRVVDGAIEFNSGKMGDPSVRRVPILVLTKTDLVIPLQFEDGIRRMDYVREQAK